jgi:hypothetical protein
MMTRDKIEEKIKELNAIRAVYRREFEEYERQYEAHEITKEKLEKHRHHFEKEKEKIRDKINGL